MKANVAALSQILQNLITNAIKYGGESRWIGIRAFRSDTTDNRPEVSIRVEDKGLGIDPADLHHVFEPFYRSPSVAGSSIHGTGLGLPLAKSIAERIGGRLTVESRVGEGSIFTIHLPVEAAAAPQREVSTTDATPHPNAT